MVTSIVLTGTYNIGISATGKIKTPDNITIDIKDIPFVRYRFDSYTEKELAFIQENKKNFPCVHVAEVTLSEDTQDILDKLTDFDEMLAKLVYVDITDENVKDGLTEEQLNLIEDILDCDFDRLIVRDKSSSLHSIALGKIKKQIKELTDIPENEIGVCGGPCCFVDGNACLTALRARELMAKYSERDDIVVPSANHEGRLDSIDIDKSCTNSCGCIRYHIYNCDMPAPSSKSSGIKKEAKKKSDSSTENVKDKKQKVNKAKGYNIINW